jgi:hypothetical protein
VIQNLMNQQEKIMPWSEEDEWTFNKNLEELLFLYKQQPLLPALASLWLRSVSAKISCEQAVHAMVLYPSSSNGRFPPKPIDLIELALGDAAHPEKALDALRAMHLDADAAWALARRAADESDTLIWTGEMAFAWDMVRDMSDDAIAQRKSFQSFYRMQVEASARSGRLPEWRVSHGWDKKKRLDRVQEAVGHGYLQLESLTADDRRMLADQRQPPQEGVQRTVAGLLTSSASTDAPASSAHRGGASAAQDDGGDWSSRSRADNLALLRGMVESANREKAESAAESRRLAREAAKEQRQKVIDALTEKLAQQPGVRLPANASTVIRTPQKH